MTADWTEERLNALVDGELTPADAEALLERLSVDAELRDRVCQLKLAKELVRHAYAGIEPERLAPPPARRVLSWRVAAGLAVFAAGSSVGWMAHEGDSESRGRAGAVVQASTPAASVGHVILHVSSADQGLAVLERAEGLIEATRGSGHEVAIEIVANGTGLDLLRAAASPYGRRIAALRAAHPALTLVACGQTVQKLRDSGADVRLLPGTVTATSALDQVVLRMQQGWAYVRI